MLALAAEHRRHLRAKFRPSSHLVSSSSSKTGIVDATPPSSSSSSSHRPAWILCAIWLSAVAAVLPYASYISYTDLSVSLRN